MKSIAVSLTKWLLIPKWLVGPLGFWVTIGVIATEVGITELVLRHQFFVAVATYYTLSIAITSMANPWDGWYQWFFRFSHGMCAVVQTEIKTHPQVEAARQQKEIEKAERHERGQG